MIPEKELDIIARETRISDWDNDVMVDIPPDSKCFLCRDHERSETSPLCKYLGVLLCADCYCNRFSTGGIEYLKNAIKQIKERERNEFR